VVREAARRLLDAVDTTGGVRLLGVGVSGLADYTQEDLFAQAAGGDRGPGADRGAGGDGSRGPEHDIVGAVPDPAARERHWAAGRDVRHERYGAGWVQGSGLGRVTVRFEEPWSQAPGRVRTFSVDDSELEPSEPLPLVAPDSARPPVA
jgi:DNA polymerase-4